MIRSGERRIVGITAGAFDLCHAGHIRMFQEAKKVCGHLVVALQDDPSKTPASYRGKKKAKPVMSLEERWEILRAIRYIDEVVVYSTEQDLYKILKSIKPDVRIIGEDWKGKKFTGYDLPMKVYYNSRKHSFSTTELRERIYNDEKKRRG